MTMIAIRLTMIIMIMIAGKDGAGVGIVLTSSVCSSVTMKIII